MSKKDEALKLAQKWQQTDWNTESPMSADFAVSEAHDVINALIDALREALAEQPAKEKAPQSANCEAPGWISSDHARGDDCTTEQPAQQEPVAYDKTEINCFAQDLYDQKMREGKRGHYESMFHVIHQCIKKVSPPAQRKPLTDEQMFEMAEIAWRHGWASCRDAEYVGKEAEDERWGMVGAEVVQDIAAQGIKENT